MTINKFYKKGLYPRFFKIMPRALLFRNAFFLFIQTLLGFRLNGDNFSAIAELLNNKNKFDVAMFYTENESRLENVCFF